MKKIVVVNNDPEFLNAIKILLQDYEGYKVRILHEGNPAYKKIKKMQPDLVILDIRLEHAETGWKVLDFLTVDPKTAHIPVIICTASVIPPEKEEWLKAHNIMTLLKPFDVNDLLALLAMIFAPKKKPKSYLRRMD